MWSWDLVACTCTGTGTGTGTRPGGVGEGERGGRMELGIFRKLEVKLKVKLVMRLGWSQVPVLFGGHGVIHGELGEMGEMGEME